MTPKEMEDKLAALEARVRQLESRPQPSKCWYCAGSGTVWSDEAGEEDCPTCKGQGVTWA